MSQGKNELFCDSTLLAQHTTCEFYGGELGHTLHIRRYQILHRSRRASGVVTAGAVAHAALDVLYAPLTTLLVYGHIHRFP